MGGFGIAGTIFVLCFAQWTHAAPAVQEFPQSVVDGGKSVRLWIKPPAGFKLNEAAPNRLELVDTAANRVFRTWNSAELRSLQVRLGKLPTQRGRWVLSSKLYVCGKVDSRVCVVLVVRQSLQVEMGTGVHELNWPLSLSKEAATSPSASSVR